MYWDMTLCLPQVSVVQSKASISPLKRMPMLLRMPRPGKVPLGYIFIRYSESPQRIFFRRRNFPRQGSRKPLTGMRKPKKTHMLSPQLLLAQEFIEAVLCTGELNSRKAEQGYIWAYGSVHTSHPCCHGGLRSDRVRSHWLCAVE